MKNDRMRTFKKAIKNHWDKLYVEPNEEDGNYDDD
jgi:hypothetical protein